MLESADTLLSHSLVPRQELTEEGVPFLVLFHHPDDKETSAQFLEQVNLQLANDKGGYRLHPVPVTR
mgnify:CR=1 FL=1